MAPFRPGPSPCRRSRGRRARAPPRGCTRGWRRAGRVSRRTRHRGGCRTATGIGRAAWRWPSRAGSRRSRPRAPTPRWCRSGRSSCAPRPSSSRAPVPRGTRAGGSREPGRRRGWDRSAATRTARAMPPWRRARRGRSAGRSPHRRGARRRPSAPTATPSPECRRTSFRATCGPRGRCTTIPARSGRRRGARCPRSGGHRSRLHRRRHRRLRALARGTAGCGSPRRRCGCCC